MKKEEEEEEERRLSLLFNENERRKAIKESLINQITAKYYKLYVFLNRK